MGIDQTGAVDRKGKPRPLPACLIRNKSVTFFSLSEFSKKEILGKVQPSRDEEILICVDCVLGLPKALKLTWRIALKRIEKVEGYGMQVAQKFFREIGKGEVLRREIEIACKANSVFKEKPFQKNIQTGTYRIWKDISLSEVDFFAPALEKRESPSQIKIFEGYPSLSWRVLFNSPTRQPRELSKIIAIKKAPVRWTKEHQAKVNQDPNFADAFVLAMTMKKFKTAALSTKPSVEGWILGYGK